DGGLGHVVPAHALQRGKDVARVRERLAEDQRREKVLDDVPGADVGLGAVVGIVFRDALAEPLRTVPLERNENEGLVVDAAEARLEEGDQRQPDQPQLQTVDTQHPSTLYSLTGDGVSP